MRLLLVELLPVNVARKANVCFGGLADTTSSQKICLDEFPGRG
jgi:hypothetical protein